MKLLTIGVPALAAAAVCWPVLNGTAAFCNTSKRNQDVVEQAVERGRTWLLAVQGRDGGWGQDGGETSYVRTGEKLEGTGNDVANTAVAALALVRAGDGTRHRAPVERAVRFILRQMDETPVDGLAITNVTGTQIQRKLGPYIDTFLTSMLFSELVGTIPDKQLDAAVARGLRLCIAKIEKHQLKDGSWNVSGGWAPILGTSMASRSLYAARQKGVAVDDRVMKQADLYAKAQMDPRTARPVGGVVGGIPGGAAGGVIGGIVGGVPSAAPPPPLAAAAGIPLYQGAQVLEQLTRTEQDRRKNAREIQAVTVQLSSDRFVSGFGSIGGEEFFSYLNISDSLRRTGGAAWNDWNNKMTAKLVSLQNSDGTWAGHHCITGRVAVTSAAMLTLLADRSLSVKAGATQ